MNNHQNRKKSPISSLVLLILLALAFYFASGNVAGREQAAAPSATAAAAQTMEERPGEKDSVFAYLRQHHELPDYYITKAEAAKLGWQGGSLEPYAPGKMIGGDRFGNFEGALPKKSGRRWTEADIGTMGKNSRGAKRIVFSSDGLIYYTENHYESFEKLGEMN